MFIHFIYLFIYLFIYSKSLIPVRRQRRVNVICICLCHETVLLFSMSSDWETVKNVVPGNSSTKPDQTGGDGKDVKQSNMFNYFVYYSRLGNNTNWCLEEASFCVRDHVNFASYPIRTTCGFVMHDAYNLNLNLFYETSRVEQALSLLKTYLYRR